MTMLKKLFVLFAIFCATPALADGVRVVVPMRDIARGEVLSLSDLGYQTVAPGTAMLGALSSAEDLVGLETRRVLHMGESLRLSDLRRPVLVAKGAMVTMSFEAPGIVLTTNGRAMSEGGLGETVTIQNPISFRQITAVVTGPGQVRTGPAQTVTKTASR
jgi:flagella basal body P-ring formation protein FlgA